MILSPFTCIFHAHNCGNLVLLIDGNLELAHIHSFTLMCVHFFFFFHFWLGIQKSSRQCKFNLMWIESDEQASRAIIVFVLITLCVRSLNLFFSVNVLIFSDSVKWWKLCEVDVNESWMLNRLYGVKHHHRHHVNLHFRAWHWIEFTHKKILFILRYYADFAQFTVQWHWLCT